MRKQSLKTKQGFTLIELLVVIGIIALLSSVILSSLTGAKAQTDNTKQIADYKTVLSALIQFKQDNGYYPSGDLNGDTCIGVYSGGGCLNANNLILSDTNVNNSLKKYLSSYNFVDKPVNITYLAGLHYASNNFRGFIVSCTNNNGSYCMAGKLSFPALKTKKACPQIMSDIKTGDDVATGVADYTWCNVDLN